MKVNPHHLHRHGKVVLSLGREEDVDSLLLEGGVAGGRGPNLDYVQLAARRPPHSETEQSAFLHRGQIQLLDNKEDWLFCCLLPVDFLPS